MMARRRNRPERTSCAEQMNVAVVVPRPWRSTLATWRQLLREQHAWMLFPILFAIAFIMPNHTAATNLYRLFIVIPMLFCFSRADVEMIWANAAARYFMLMCGYLMVSLFFDGWTQGDRQMLVASLNIYGLFYLSFLVCRYQQHRGGQILDSFFVLGLIGAVLIVLKWESLRDLVEAWLGPMLGREVAPLQAWDRAGATRGVFSNPIFVSWVMADLGIIAFYRMLLASTYGRMGGYAAAGLFFAAITFCLETRAGYMMLIAGILLLVVLFNNRRVWFALLAVVAVGAVLAVAFSEVSTLIWRNAMERGMSFRTAIWSNGIQAISDSWTTLVFGHGMSVSTDNRVGDVLFPHYHSFFLNHTFYAGLIGLGLCLAFLGLTLHKTFRSPQLQLWGVLLAAMLVGFLTAGKLLFVGLHAHTLAFFMPAFLGLFGLELSRGER